MGTKVRVLTLFLALLPCFLAAPVHGVGNAIPQGDKPVPPDTLLDPEARRFLDAAGSSSTDPPSGFEMFLGGVTPVTEGQFDVLKRMDGVAFSESPGPLPDGAIRVPIRVVRDGGADGRKTPAQPGIVTAGYLTGRREAVARAFSLVGIRSAYSESRELRQFGYDFFDRVPAPVAPARALAVGPDYVVGPGDEIRIAVWGKVDAQYRVVVDREGNVQVPVVGVIGVAGMSYGDLKEAIRKELARFYTGFEVNVTLGALRTLSVYVVGKAKSPGLYAVSPVSTLVNVLVATGGPGRAGSLRNIELHRGGKRIASFDFYDFLLRGNSREDVRILQNDVVLVPPVGPLVGLSGSVRSPAIYELKGETGLRDLVQMAGGLGPETFLGRVRIERIADGKRVEILEGDLSSALGRNEPLRDGDLVTVFPVESERSTVAVYGAVQREGSFGLNEGMRVSDLLSLAGGLKAFAHPGEAELARVRKGDGASVVEVRTIDLEKAVAGDPAHNVALGNQDRLFVKQVRGGGRQRYASVSGEVRYPGTYSIRDGERISSLVERAGGFTGNAYLRGAVFERESVRELQQRRLGESIDRLEREVLSRGSASLSVAGSSEELKARESEILQARQFLERLKAVRATGRMVLELSPPDTLRKSRYDLELENGDSLLIPENPGSLQTLGAVFNQTAFVFDGAKGMQDYIDMAGGYTESADKDRVFVLKANGAAIRPELDRFFLSSRTEYRTRDGSPLLEPGDSIVVPEKLDRIAWLRETKDITQILFQIAVAAGVVIALF